MARLLRVTLRYRTVCILVGEARGGEAPDLLKARNTSHPGGLATIYASSTAPGRPEQCTEEVSAGQLELVSSALEVIRTVRVKKACVRCDCIVEAPAPSRPIVRGIAGPGLLAAC